jgi:hypothetical protein
MSGPLQVDPNQLDGTGMRWYALIPDLDGKPPTSGSGMWPSVIGVQAVSGAAQASTASLQGRLGGAAGQMQADGGDYQKMDTGSAKDLSTMMTGVVKDLSGTGTNLIQTVGQTEAGVIGPLTSGAAAAGSALASALSSTISAASKGTPHGTTPLGTEGQLQGQAPDDDHH